MSKRKHIETSIDVYKALQPEQLRQTYKDILFALSQLGEATTEQIAEALKVKPDKIWRRVSEMHRMGLIYRPGTKRLMTSGSMGYTWKLTQPGQSSETVVEKALPGKSVSDFSKKILQQQLF
jgi:predicted transcriptional regulator